MDEFPKKLKKKLPANFEEAAESYSTTEIKERILDSEKKIIEIEREKEADMTLASLKEKVKDLNGGYKDALDCEKVKIKYLMFVRETRGEI